MESNERKRKLSNAEDSGEKSSKRVEKKQLSEEFLLELYSYNGFNDFSLFKSELLNYKSTVFKHGALMNFNKWKEHTSLTCDKYHCCVNSALLIDHFNQHFSDCDLTPLMKRYESIVQSILKGIKECAVYLCYNKDEPSLNKEAPSMTEYLLETLEVFIEILQYIYFFIKVIFAMVEYDTELLFAEFQYSNLPDNSCICDMQINKPMFMRHFKKVIHKCILLKSFLGCAIRDGYKVEKECKQLRKLIKDFYKLMFYY